MSVSSGPKRARPGTGETSPAQTTTATNDDVVDGVPSVFGVAKLHRGEVERYSRQILLPEVTAAGARALIDASVLVVGAGGLGSSILLYLAAAGIGRIAVVDFDAVDRSNLHRQVAHTDDRVGMNKAVSAAIACRAINPTVAIETIEEPFNATNGQALVNRFDVIVDASDNVATRYLINDACALAAGGRKPLVSGSAMRWEGQLTVYNYGAEGPCFRCMFPTPPPPSTVGSCNDVGVIGAVPGAIGTLQALEVQKILMPGAAAEGGVLAGRMLFWDGLRGTFRVMKLRPRNPACAVCGSVSQGGGSITALASVGAAYEPGACARTITNLPPQNHIAPAEFKRLRDAGKIAALLDVREQLQYDMCALNGAINVPLTALDRAAGAEQTRNPAAALQLVQQALGISAAAGAQPPELLVAVICRRGVASSKAVKLLLEATTTTTTADGAGEAEGPVRFVNVDGGLTALCSAGVLTGFPVY